MQAQSVMVSDGKDARGRFLPGHKFAKGGNHRSNRIKILRDLVLDTVTEQDIQEVIAVLREQALKGDVQAAKLFLAYAIGQPEAPEKTESNSIIDVGVFDSIPRDKLKAILLDKSDDSDG